MKFTTILAIFFLIIALVFALQNTSALSINFLAWNWSLSTSLMVIIIFLFGLICGWLLELRAVWRKNQEIKSLKKKLPGTNDGH